jgi:Na+/proline symporter
MNPTAILVWVLILGWYVGLGYLSYRFVKRITIDAINEESTLVRMRVTAFLIWPVFWAIFIVVYGIYQAVRGVRAVSKRRGNE